MQKIDKVGQHNTDDEKSALDVANPDSFLGASMTNFSAKDGKTVV